MHMKNAFLKALLLLAAIASASQAGDKAFLRQKTLEILDACSPDGSRIVRLGLKLEKYSASGDFTTLITGNDERACATSINTVVHEENHGLHTFMGREVLKEKYGRFSDAYYKYDYYYMKDGQFTLMKKTPTFPSRELVPSIPNRLRTYRFADYIKLQSTQNTGIFGLVDEFNSYTQGTRAAFDLLSYYEKKGAQADWHDYFTGVNSTYYGCLEFKFYILKYLMFAKKAHPDIYNTIMNRKDQLALERGGGINDLEVEFEDPEGDAGAASVPASSDVRFPFIDLVRASMTKTGNGLTVRMQFADLPDEMPFNQSGVDDNQMEFQWRVLFDLDGNGTDDYSIDVIHFKKSGDRPVRGELFGYAKASLWKVRKDGASLEDVSVNGEKQENEIVIEVPPCPFVSKVRKETRIRFSTYHTNGNHWAEDFLPD
jgi:hypothetical protein